MVDDVEEIIRTEDLTKQYPTMDVPAVDKLSTTTLLRHLLVAKSGERRQKVIKQLDCAAVQNSYGTTKSNWSGRRESTSRSQLGKLSLICDVGLVGIDRGTALNQFDDEFPKKLVLAKRLTETRPHSRQ